MVCISCGTDLFYKTLSKHNYCSLAYFSTHLCILKRYMCNQVMLERYLLVFSYAIKTKVRYAKMLWVFYDFHRGVPNGQVLSPKLLNVYKLFLAVFELFKFNYQLMHFFNCTLEANSQTTDCFLHLSQNKTESHSQHWK